MREAPRTIEADPGLAAEAGTEDPGKLGRIRAGIPVVPVFDGFRAWAVLGVVMVHVFIISGVLPYSNDNLVGLLAWGTIGQMLDMLFIISGFVIFLPTVAKGGAFGSKVAFAVRRISRLFPAYWTVLLIMLLLIATVPVDQPLPFPSVSEIVLHATTLEVPAEFFRNDFFLGFGINRALWTLSSEVFFYLLLPFVAGFYYRRPFLGLAIAGAVTALWKVAFARLHDLAELVGADPTQATIDQLRAAADIQFPAWMYSIALGMTAAWIYVRLRPRVESGELLSRVRVAQAVSFAALAAFVYLAGDISRGAPFLLAPEYARHSPLMAIGFSTALAASMLTIALAPVRVGFPFANRPVRWLADNSVGMYMIHMVIISYLAYLLALPQDGSLEALLIWAAIVVPATVAYGWASAKFVERPARRRAQAWVRGRAEAKPAAERREAVGSQAGGA